MTKNIYINTNLLEQCPKSILFYAFVHSFLFSPEAGTICKAEEKAWNSYTVQVMEGKKYSQGSPPWQTSSLSVPTWSRLLQCRPCVPPPARSLQAQKCSVPKKKKKWWQDHVTHKTKPNEIDIKLFCWSCSTTCWGLSSRPGYSTDKVTYRTNMRGTYVPEKMADKTPGTEGYVWFTYLNHVTILLYYFQDVTDVQGWSLPDKTIISNIRYLSFPPPLLRHWTVRYHASLCRDERCIRRIKKLPSPRATCFWPSVSHQHYPMMAFFCLFFLIKDIHKEPLQVWDTPPVGKIRQASRFKACHRQIKVRRQQQLRGGTKVWLSSN